MGQGIVTTQFYLYGRQHFTRTGWESHSADYRRPDPLKAIDLAGRRYVVTGANSGIGKEIAAFLARKGGRVYMVCRDEARGKEARLELLETTGASPDLLKLVIADVGLRADVERTAAFITSEEEFGIDALVCNAGGMSHDRTVTKDGIETTFATHFLFGSYLLTKLLLPVLRNAGNFERDSRVIFVSSGGMYNVAFPDWNVAASLPDGSGELPEYDGQFAYAYAKRGQVLLAEYWTQSEGRKAAANEKPVSFVSAHPGWTATQAVKDAYGDSASWLEPMRDTWQGAEGICWLCSMPVSKIESGAFYLDRTPQVKHMAGPFFTEGSYTQNTGEDVRRMIAEADKLMSDHDKSAGA